MQNQKKSQFFKWYEDAIKLLEKDPSFIRIHEELQGLVFLEAILVLLDTLER